MISTIKALPLGLVSKTSSEVLFADSLGYHQHHRLCRLLVVVIALLGQHYAASHTVLRSGQNQRGQNLLLPGLVGQGILPHQLHMGRRMDIRVHAQLKCCRNLLGLEPGEHFTTMV